MSQQYTRCPHCGTTATPGQHFCVGCGTLLAKDMNEADDSTIELPMYTAPLEPLYTAPRQPAAAPANKRAAAPVSGRAAQPTKKKRDRMVQAIAIAFGVLVLAGVVFFGWSSITTSAAEKELIAQITSAQTPADIAALRGQLIVFENNNPSARLPRDLYSLVYAAEEYERGNPNRDDRFTGALSSFGSLKGSSNEAIGDCATRMEGVVQSDFTAYVGTQYTAHLKLLSQTYSVADFAATHQASDTLRSRYSWYTFDAELDALYTASETFCAAARATQAPYSAAGTVFAAMRSSSKNADMQALAAHLSDCLTMEHSYHFEDAAPVTFGAQAMLLSDNGSLRFTITNLSDKTVERVSVRVYCFDAEGKPALDASGSQVYYVEYKGEGNGIQPDETFNRPGESEYYLSLSGYTGATQAVVFAQSVTFSDGSTWQSSQSDAAAAVAAAGLAGQTDAYVAIA